ncbi:MAG TPA: hypothetical protein VNA65_08650 [Candidatus Dormibacteraeota bacterium]|nr:hypothetical protein [Candidatus Dormibacteraeota bacterium]
MPELPRRPAVWASEHPWVWGVVFGLVVGGSVLILSSIEHGLRASNLVLGLVVFIAFGLLGVVGALFRRYTPGGPA